MLVIVSTLLAVVITIALVFSAQVGILLTLISKPVIDATWSSHVAGISASKLISGVVPLLVLFHARHQGKRLSDMPMYGIWMIYLVYNILSTTSAIFNKDIITYFDQAMRVLNSFIGFYMLQAYFSKGPDFKRLLEVFLVASIFPLAVAMYQALTGVVLHESLSVGFSRNVGFYHDGMALKLFSFQTLIVIMLYWSYFITPRTKFVLKAMLAGIAAISLVSLFNLYSKSGYVVVAIWAVIWAISRRQFATMAGVLVLIIATSLIFYGRISSTVEQVYWKELSAVSEETQLGVSEERKQMRSFSGRWYKWEQVMNIYVNASIFDQIFGIGHGVGAHNDFLNRLVANGLIGLILYIALLIAIGSRVFKNYLRLKQPIHVAAFMLFSMWLVDTIGAVPSGYIEYQWFVWGIIALSFKGIDIDKSGRSVKASDAQIKKQQRRILVRTRRKDFGEI